MLGFRRYRFGAHSRQSFVAAPESRQARQRLRELGEGTLSLPRDSLNFFQQSAQRHRGTLSPLSSFSRDTRQPCAAEMSV
jgi:hypothetical protein